MKIQNVTLTTVPLAAGDSDDVPPHAPPPDNVPDFHLPTGDEIAQRLKEQREREAGRATQDSAVASMAGDGAAAAGPYALLGEPPLAGALRAMPGASSGIIVIGGAEATRASVQTAALPPDGPLPSMAAFEGEAPPLGHLGDPKNRDVGKEIDAPGLFHADPLKARPR